MINLELLARLLSIAVTLGELRFEPGITAKICDRLIQLVFTADDQELGVLADELQQILIDEGAAQEQRWRGAIH